jgi:cyclophilin family peptidyl-prolyl cis-trans isomerase
MPTNRPTNIRTTRRPGLRLATALLVLLATAPGCRGASDSKEEKQAVNTAADSLTVVISTSKGVVEIELDEKTAPTTVANFLAYVDEGFYDDTIFHRVIPAFMIQGGGFDTGYKQKDTRAAIKNEADNGLTNLSGTIAMARTNAVNSATAQFFINAKDNPFLDHKDTSTSGYGYAVFGRVVAGLDIVRSIENAPTTNRGGAFTNAPVDQVVIESIKRK